MAAGRKYTSESPPGAWPFFLQSKGRDALVYEERETLKRPTSLTSGGTVKVPFLEVLVGLGL